MSFELKKIKFKKIDSRKFMSAKLKIFDHLRKFIHEILRIFVYLRKFLSLKYKYFECSFECKSVKDDLIEYKSLFSNKNYENIFDEN